MSARDELEKDYRDARNLMLRLRREAPTPFHWHAVAAACAITVMDDMRAAIGAHWRALEGGSASLADATPIISPHTEESKG